VGEVKKTTPTCGPKENYVIKSATIYLV